MPFVVDEDDFRRQDFDRFDDRDRFELEMRSRENEERRRRELEQRERDEDNRKALTSTAEAELKSALEKATAEEMRLLVNDPTLRISSRGRITRTRPSGRDVIRSSGQFSRANLIPNVRKPRKKNKKHCKNLSMCLRQANSELRTKKGSLRKGKTQADIMRRAQRLLKKMK
jgi:hypothetical protein